MIPGPTPQLGAWVKLPTPESVELLALAGFEFVVIDGEHAAIDVRTITTMIATARGCGIAPFVRVAGTAPRDVQVPLDAGAHGLFVPQVNDVSAARAAVRATRFPPLGRRGASPSGRAGRWGLDSLADYVAAGAEVRLVVQVETADALEAITEIGGLDGVDAVFVGPADIAVGSGLLDDDAGLASLVRAAERRCAEAGVRVGTAASGDATSLVGRGYDFLVLGADTAMLRAGGRALVDAVRGGQGSDR